jgi:hypothetical protein
MAGTSEMQSGLERSIPYVRKGRGSPLRLSRIVVPALGLPTAIVTDA